MPIIKISDFVKKTLDDIKEKEQHKSLDSAIRSLLATRHIKEILEGQE